MRKNIWIPFLFIVGLLIFIYPHVAQYVNGKIQKTQAEQFKENTALLTSEYISEQLKEAKKCNEAIFENEDGLQDPFTEGYNRDDYQGCEKAPTDGAHFASIEIPKLNLEIPIYLGATENELSKGIGQVEGSSLPIGGMNTHTVLAGHRGMGTKAMFRNLDALSVNDTFYIHTMEGKLRYKVYDVEVILPHETDNLLIHEGKDLASLITCHPYRANSHRLVIHGERVN